VRNGSESAVLSAFAANLRFQDIPDSVAQRSEELFLDWFGSALAGRGARPVEAIECFANQMASGATGRSEVLIKRRFTTPLFAAMVNAAASHSVEQDDVHSGAVFHPATVVFPPALAVAQEIGASGRSLLAASVAGYEVGIRVGEFLGRSHYETFHTTGTAGALASAAAVGNLLRITPAQMLHAFGSAGTQAAGLWEFLRDGADSKQLHTAKAAVNGLIAAYLAREGFTGASQILEGPKGMAAGMSRDADPERLTERLGSRWATLETSFKYHASCRHTHPAADALLKVIATHRLGCNQIAEVTAHVHQAAIDVLGAVENPRTVHQAKFSMGTVLGLLAVFGRAGVREFENHWNEPRVVAFRERVRMLVDDEVDRAYPVRWIGKITVLTSDGRTLHERVDKPKGDPGNSLTRSELEEKAIELAAYSDAASEEEMKAVFRRIRDLSNGAKVGPLLSQFR
jgi:2-methylcitrate dehydratase PrpD